MSAEIACKSLQLQPAEALAIAAGNLLHSEFCQGDEQQLVPDEGAGSRYISSLKPGIDNLYAITSPEAGLLAASRVIHNSYDGYTTYVAFFAVQPNHRNHGHGRRLMQFIGFQALAQGDKWLDLYTDIPDYFVGLGFTSTLVIGDRASRSHRMAASAKDVLSSAP